MEVKITIHTVTIIDETGDKYTIKTVRDASEIAECLQEDEKEQIIWEAEQAVIEALQ